MASLPVNMILKGLALAKAVNSPLTALAPAAGEVKAVIPTEPIRKNFSEIVDFVEEKTLSGKTVDMDEVDELYHRTTPGNAISILETGVVKAYEEENGEIDIPDPSVRTSKISFSASPRNTYGGTVRLVWDKDEIEAELEPVMYYDENEELVRAYGEYLGIANKNEIRAIMGVSPKMYSSEAEVMALDIIEAPPKRVEFWLTRKPESFNVSCTGTGDLWVRWKGTGQALDEFYKFLDYFIRLEKIVEDKINQLLELRSCYDLVNIGDGSLGSEKEDVFFETTPEGLGYFRDAIEAYYHPMKDGYARFDTQSIRDVINNNKRIKAEKPDTSKRSEMANPRTFKCKC